MELSPFLDCGERAQRRRDFPSRRSHRRKEVEQRTGWSRTPPVIRFRPLHAGGVLAARELLPQTEELSSGTRAANVVERLALRAVVPRRAARHELRETVRPRSSASARSTRAGLSQRDKHHHISFQRENCYHKRRNFPAAHATTNVVARLALRAVVPRRAARHELRETVRLRSSVSTRSTRAEFSQRENCHLKQTNFPAALRPPTW